MLDSQTLHPYGFIIAHVVIEGVALATKVIHNCLGAQRSHHLGIVPWKAQMILWSWCHLPVRHGQGCCSCTFLSVVWWTAGKRWYISVSRWQINSIQAVGQCQCLAANRMLARLSSFSIVYKLFIDCTLPILKCCTLSLCLYLIYLLCNIYFSVANRRIHLLLLLNKLPYWVLYSKFTVIMLILVCVYLSCTLHEYYCGNSRSQRFCYLYILFINFDIYENAR